MGVSFLGLLAGSYETEIPADECDLKTAVRVGLRESDTFPITPKPLAFSGYSVASVAAIPPTPPVVGSPAVMKRQKLSMHVHASASQAMAIPELT